MSRRLLRPARVERLAVLLALQGTLAACMVGPNYVRPKTDPPASFKSQTAAADAPPLTTEWWQLYDDPELTRLVTMATTSNQTLAQAVAAVDEARALARMAAADLAPTITANPTFTRERTSATANIPDTGITSRGVTTNNWLLPIDLFYEIDVWGRVRRGLESARAQAVASADDEALVRLTVQTDVAQGYFGLRLLDTETDILTETVASYREQVRILSVQLKNGLVSPLVVSQAEALLQTTLAQLRDTQRARNDQEHALAVLCGQPAPEFTLSPRPLGEMPPPKIPPGLPAMLLARRPDVAAAEQAVVAANARIGVAMAEFYPQFSLASFVGFESANVRSLTDWKSRVASLVPGVAQPIFEGGRLKANLAATRAQYRQTVAAYIEQILVAYADVEDALSDLHAYIDEVENLRRAVTASREYRRVAQAQYTIGLVDYLTVIDAERTLLSNQLLLIERVNLNLGASIRLIKALGGGWQAGQGP